MAVYLDRWTCTQLCMENALKSKMSVLPPTMKHLLASHDTTKQNTEAKK